MKNKEKLDKIVFCLCILILVLILIFMVIFAIQSFNIPDEPHYYAYGYGYIENDKNHIGLVNEHERFVNVGPPNYFYPEKDIMKPLNSDDTWIDKSYYQEVVVVTREEKIKSKKKVKYKFNDDNFETNSYTAAVMHSFKSDDDCQLINYEDVKVIPEKHHTEKILIKCGYWSSDKEGPSKCEEEFIPPYILK